MIGVALGLAVGLAAGGILILARVRGERAARRERIEDARRRRAMHDVTSGRVPPLYPGD